MSLTTGEMTPADLSAVVGNRDNGFGGDSGWWIILLFLCLFGNGGWGNGFGGGNNGGTGSLFYPFMNQTDTINNGFRDQMLNDNITGIRDSINGISTQLCNGFSDIQMTGMQNAFGLQNAINSGVNGIQAQLASCCCDNRLASADLKYTIATENCADRQALSESTMSIIANQTASTQRILDQLCNDKIESKNETIAQLRQELLYARGQASQDVQTAILRQGQEAEVDALYNRLNNCPVPSMPVYGRTPIFTCNGNTGCGCGCNG